MKSHGLSTRARHKDSLRAGDKVTVEYWPLRDGRNGGHLALATLADGRKLQSVGGLGAAPSFKGGPPPR